MKKEVLLYPRAEAMLRRVGAQIRLARLRRRLSTSLVAERAKISRSTLWKIENGEAGVSIGAYVSVLCAIGLGKDILLLARDDDLIEALGEREIEKLIR